MNVPAEEERGIAAQGDGTNEILPSRLREQLEKRQTLEDECEDETRSGADLGQNSERGVSDQAASDALQRALVDGPAKSRGNYEELATRKTICQAINLPWIKTRSAKE